MIVLCMVQEGDKSEKQVEVGAEGASLSNKDGEGSVAVQAAEATPTGGDVEMRQAEIQVTLRRQGRPPGYLPYHWCAHTGTYMVCSSKQNCIPSRTDLLSCLLPGRRATTENDHVLCTCRHTLHELYAEEMHITSFAVLNRVAWMRD